MVYRDVDALLVRIARLEASLAPARARAKRLARRRMVRVLRWVPILVFVPMLVGAILFVLVTPCWHCYDGSPKNDAKIAARGLVPVAEKWHADHPEAPCPTMEKLQFEGELSMSSRLDDPWQHRYRIRCEGDDISVASAGPDGYFGTSDDIVVPESPPPPSP